MIQIGKVWKRAGGIIRQAKPKPPRIPETIREEVRTLHETGKYSQRQLAEMFGVNPKTISNIVNGK